MIFDLHSHSTASDGVLAPSALVARAAERGVGTLALTDHDTVRGLAEAQTEAQAVGIRLIYGVEISVTWEGRSVHVLGLNIDPDDKALGAGLAGLRAGRVERAERMAESLAAVGIGGPSPGRRSMLRAVT